MLSILYREFSFISLMTDARWWEGTCHSRISSTCENGPWGHTGLAFDPPALDHMGPGGWVQGVGLARWGPCVDVCAPCPPSGLGLPGPISPGVAEQHCSNLRIKIYFHIILMENFINVNILFISKVLTELFCVQNID